MTNWGRVRRIVFALAGVTLLVVLVAFTNDYLIGVVVVVGIYAIALLGLDIIKGYTGLLSLGQAGFMGVAGYTSAILTARVGWEPLLALLAALALALLVALVMAVPCSRLTGFNLALATLGFVIITNTLFLGARSLTGGATGVAGVPPFRAFGVAFDSQPATLLLVWATFGGLYWLAHGVVNSPVGSALRAIKEDELAASANGIDVFQYKILAFLLAAGYAAVAGSLYVHAIRFISPDMVDWTVSTGLITMLVLGGEGRLWGVLPGAFLLRLVPELFNQLQDYLLLLQGLILILVMIYLPGGLAGALWQKKRA